VYLQVTDEQPLAPRAAQRANGGSLAVGALPIRSVLHGPIRCGQHTLRGVFASKANPRSVRSGVEDEGAHFIAAVRRCDAHGGMARLRFNQAINASNDDRGGIRSRGMSKRAAAESGELRPTRKKASVNGAGRQAGEGESSVLVRALVGLEEATLLADEVTARSKKDAAPSLRSRILVTDSVPGAIHRVVSAEGSADAVADAFGVICSALHSRRTAVDADESTSPLSLRLITPAMLTRQITGPRHANLDEISKQTNANLHMSSTLLPLSTERTLVITGDLEALRAAVLAIAKVYLVSAERLQSLPSVVYTPKPVYGTFGHPRSIRQNPAIISPHAPYGIFPPPSGAQEAAAANAAAAAAMRAQPHPAASRKFN